MFGLERALGRNRKIGRLFRGHHRQLHADLAQMQLGDLFVEVLGQGEDLLAVMAGLGPQLDLGQGLVGERGRHHEGRVAGRVAEVHQAAFRQQDDALAVGELDLVDLRLDVVPLEVAQRRRPEFPSRNGRCCRRWRDPSWRACGRP